MPQSANETPTTCDGFLPRRADGELVVAAAPSASAQRFVRQTQRIASPLAPSAGFGRIVDVDSDTAVVSATSASRTYIYERSGGISSFAQ